MKQSMREDADEGDVMSRSKNGFARIAELFRRPAALLSVALILLFAQPGGHAAAPLQGDVLGLVTSVLVTGNYVVGGIDLPPQQAVGGRVSGTIQISGVPRNADVLAAYLYWETIAVKDATVPPLNAIFRGQDVQANTIHQKFKQTLDPSTSPCWS